MIKGLHWKTVLPIVLCAAACFGSLGMLLWSFQSRVALIREIEIDRHGYVETRPRGPDWVRSWCGYRSTVLPQTYGLLDRVVAIDVGGSCVDDDFLSRLHQLPELERISITGPQFSARTLDELAGFSQLSELNIRYPYPAVGQAGLPTMERIGRHQKLRLRHTGYHQARTGISLSFRVD